VCVSCAAVYGPSHGTCAGPPIPPMPWAAASILLNRSMLCDGVWSCVCSGRECGVVEKKLGGGGGEGDVACGRWRRRR
jgi:hypothetical protein